jgi:hypothetical protein
MDGRDEVEEGQHGALPQASLGLERLSSENWTIRSHFIRY